ncbi:MAG: HU family DNA-binding protein [Paludibacteraceae bacterium]|nr:HU family DNA-binding protein [Paludibacteraceae bacterium]
MNNKVTLQDLADQLSAISGQSKKLSEGFLRALTEIVEEALAKDGIAKVKGIGTFKIVAIEERKSVSVTDGSAVIIPAHKKITFTPEKELKEAVNKPYEDLETYVLPNDGPVDGPFIDEDDEEGEDLTSATDYTTINPVETSAWTSSANASTTPSEPTVTQPPVSTIETKTETPQASQPVSSPSPAEPVTPSYNYTSNAYSTPGAGTPTAGENITSNNSTETVDAQSPIQETTTPPVSEPTPTPEPTITYTATPAPEASLANEPVTETCAPVGHTPAEEIKQTAENTTPIVEPQQTTTASSVETPQATAYTAPSEETPQASTSTVSSVETPQATAYTAPSAETPQASTSTASSVETPQPTADAATTPSEESVKQGEPTASQEPQGEAEQPVQAEVKEEPIQNAAPTDNAGEATDKKEEPTATATANEPAAQATDSTQQATQDGQAQAAAAAATTSGSHNGKHKHHKKKKERNKGLLAVIIILALLIIACLVYALQSNKGFSNGLNDLKGKITGIFSDKQPVPVVVDSALVKDTISKEQAEVDEFFEEKTEDMYEAAQADQEFPMEVEEEQNWDWFEEGVKKFIKKEYPKLNFEVKGEPIMDTIRRGQTLTSMSRKHYNGVKDFWVYIYLYNKDVIRRPDDVSVGTPIKIPQLDESVIDPNSYVSINAAKDVKESYLRLFN